MFRLDYRTWILATALLVCGLLTEARATPPSYFPSYVLLRPPVASSHVAPTHGVYPGRAIPVHTSAYSYGWFGAAPRKHCTLHHGYYDNYTEWSSR